MHRYPLLLLLLLLPDRRLCFRSGEIFALNICQAARSSDGRGRCAASPHSRRYNVEGGPLCGSFGRKLLPLPLLGLLLPALLGLNLRQ